MKTYRELFILLVIFGGLWAVAVYYFSEKEADTNSGLLSAKNKIKLADYLHNNFISENEVYFHQEVDSAVSVILNRLSRGDSTVINYQLSILQSEETNAFATLDGRIYVFTGLLKKCESPEMLAAVLAHEMGHIENEHLVQRLINELGATLLLSVLTGGDPIMVSELGKTAVSLHFNREQEREADEFGRNLLVRSNIDPVRFAQFMMIIKREEGQANSFAFINTHPAVDERILSSTSYKVPADFKELKFEIDWERVQSILDGQEGVK